MPSNYQHQANLQYPRSAKKRNILGDGPYAIVNKCDPRGWKIYLYPTAEARAAKLAQWSQGCCWNCCGQHGTTTIVVDEAWQQHKFEESGGRARL
jgi:hypothetical protein